MDGNKCILQLRGLRPFFSPKYNLKNHPNYKYTSEADKRNAFDSASLFGKQMKVKPNDVFIVYDAESTDDEPKYEDEDILNYDDTDDPDAFA